MDGINPIAPIGSAEVREAQPDQLRALARELEGAFLSEMLKHGGFGVARGAFGGGIGEDQFSSFLRDIHAEQMAESGGIGLAESIFRSLTGRADER